MGAETASVAPASVLDFRFSDAVESNWFFGGAENRVRFLQSHDKAGRGPLAFLQQRGNRFDAG